MSTLQMPSEPAIDRAAARLMEGATPKEQRQIAKAQYQLRKGLAIIATADGALLIPSATTGTVHRLTSLGQCSCPATRGCYHDKMRQILELAHALPCEIPLTPFANVASFDPSRIIARIKAARTSIDDPLPDPGPGGPGVPGDERPRQPSNWQRFVGEDTRQIQKSNMRAEILEIKARPKLGYEQALAAISELFN